MLDAYAPESPILWPVSRGFEDYPRGAMTRTKALEAQIQVVLQCDSMILERNCARKLNGLTPSRHSVGTIGQLLPMGTP